MMYPGLALLLFVATCFTGDMTGIDPPREGVRGVTFEGEQLLYEVSWAFIKLGTIHLKLGPDRRPEAHIDSYEGLKVVDLHAIHTSAMDSSFFSRACQSIDKDGDLWNGLDYEYDFPNRRLVVREMTKKDPTAPAENLRVRDTIALTSTRFIDGISIAYYPRAFIHMYRTVVVPTVLYGKMGETTFHFDGNRTTVSVDALEKPVRVVEVHGTTSVEGIYGMTGDFTGWFSDDAAAVPIKGKLKVLIGSVNVELIAWRRGTWSPPVAD